LISASTIQEAKQWVNALTQVSLNKPLNGKVFGKKLDELEVNSNSVPLVIEQMISFLTACGLETAGIFSIPGEAERVKELCQQFDNDFSYYFFF